MTRYKQLHILLFLLAAFFTACKPPIDPKAQLRKAERNIETNPEAALASLDSILNPDLSLRHADHMKYALLHAEATYLSFKEVKNDTAIFEACRYYEKKQDLPQLTKATLTVPACWKRKARPMPPLMPTTRPSPWQAKSPTVRLWQRQSIIWEI